jgi:hypothetical protein
MINNDKDDDYDDSYLSTFELINQCISYNKISNNEIEDYLKGQISNCTCSSTVDSKRHYDSYNNNGSRSSSSSSSRNSSSSSSSSSSGGSHDGDKLTAVPVNAQCLLRLDGKNVDDHVEIDDDDDDDDNEHDDICYDDDKF